jgi:hypothetical protein
MPIHCLISSKRAVLEDKSPTSTAIFMCLGDFVVSRMDWLTQRRAIRRESMENEQSSRFEAIALYNLDFQKKNSRVPLVPARVYDIIARNSVDDNHIVLSKLILIQRDFSKGSRRPRRSPSRQRTTYQSRQDQIPRELRLPDYIQPIDLHQSCIHLSRRSHPIHWERKRDRCSRV